MKVYAVDMVQISDKTTGVARWLAIAIGLLTAVNLPAGGAIRADNMFLVPDLLVAAALLVAALLPRAVRATALLFAFGPAAGVFTVAAFSYVVRGELGLVSVFAATCFGAAGLLARHIVATLRNPSVERAVPAAAREFRRVAKHGSELA
jgi:hypothetical protein